MEEPQEPVHLLKKHEQWHVLIHSKWMVPKVRAFIHKAVINVAHKLLQVMLLGLLGLFRLGLVLVLVRVGVTNSSRPCSTVVATIITIVIVIIVRVLVLCVRPAPLCIVA